MTLLRNGFMSSIDNVTMIRNMCSLSLQRLLILAYGIFCVVWGDLNYSYHTQGLSWYHAQLSCQHQGGQLFIPRPGQSLEFYRHMANSQSIWAGGRIYHHSWKWSDGTELYEGVGCYDDDLRLGALVVKLVSLSAPDVFLCLVNCQSPYVGVQMDRCLCLRVAPPRFLRKADSVCDAACAASMGDKCGGGGVYSVYRTELLPYELKTDVSDQGSPSVDDHCGYLYHTASSPSLGPGGDSLFLMFDLCTARAVQRKKFICQNCSNPTPQEGHLTCTAIKKREYTTWNLASEQCREMGMSLATPASGDLRPVFNFALGTQESYWVGLRRESTLSWVDGTSLSSLSLPAPQPVDGECVSVVSTPTGQQRLQLEDCDRGKPYICDFGSAPPSLPPTVAHPYTVSSEPTAGASTARQSSASLSPTTTTATTSLPTTSDRSTTLTATPTQKEPTPNSLTTAAPLTLAIITTSPTSAISTMASANTSPTTETGTASSTPSPTASQTQSLNTTAASIITTTALTTTVPTASSPDSPSGTSTTTTITNSNTTTTRNVNQSASTSFISAPTTLATSTTSAVITTTLATATTTSTTATTTPETVTTTLAINISHMQSVTAPATNSSTTDTAPATATPTSATVPFESLNSTTKTTAAAASNVTTQRSNSTTSATSTSLTLLTSTLPNSTTPRKMDYLDGISTPETTTPLTVSASADTTTPAISVQSTIEPAFSKDTTMCVIPCKQPETDPDDNTGEDLLPILLAVAGAFLLLVLLVVMVTLYVRRKRLSKSANLQSLPTSP